MSTNYQHEMRTFSRLRRGITSAAKEEFEEATNLLVERYDTAIWENRFVVGGVIKMLTLALLRSVGIDCELCEGTTRHGSIRLLKSKRLLSVKSNLNGMGSIRLINKLGKGERKWETATLFVVARVGIIFGAPGMVPDGCVKGKTGDATILTSAGLKLLAEDDRRVIPMNVPYKPSVTLSDPSAVASAAIATQILTRVSANVLKARVKNELQ